MYIRECLHRISNKTVKLWAFAKLRCKIHHMHGIHYWGFHACEGCEESKDKDNKLKNFCR